MAGKCVSRLEARALATNNTRGRSIDMSGQTGGQQGNPNASATVSRFKVGDLVALRSDPSVHLPILEVIAGGAECRYRVFQNNTKATYYESQLQAISQATDREVIAVQELHARLTSLQILSPSTANLFSLRS